jgi:phytanoyl-CoA hydroxylase
VRNLLPSLLGKRGAVSGRPGRSGPLTAEGLLASDLWVDQPDAHRRIDGRLRKGEITADQAERLRCFVDRGYMTFPSGLPDSVITGIQEQVDRAWREKPWDLAYARVGPMRPLATADEAQERKASYRIADLHSWCEPALAAYLHRPVFEHVELILGEPAVATQSLYFEYGSQQALHRDPVFVPTTPPSHLLAAWIALEDIVPGCGPLVYVPGTHRLPYYQFEPGEYRFDHSRYGEKESEAMAEFDRRQAAARGLEPETLLCPRGEVLIWHASLLHGGAAVEDPSLTRKSFVVHFSSRADHKLRRQRIAETVPTGDGGQAERSRIFETETVLVRDGCHGFDNPLRGYRPD